MVTQNITYRVPELDSLSHLTRGGAGAPQAAPRVAGPWRTWRVARAQRDGCAGAAGSHGAPTGQRADPGSVSQSRQTQ